MENTAAWAAAEDSSSVYCNSDEPMPICPYGCWHWSGEEAALRAEVWAEECRKAHRGRPLSLLELQGTTEGRTLVYEYADRNLHSSLKTWLLPYAKEPPGSPYLRQHDILTFTLPTVLLSLGPQAYPLAAGWKLKKMETFRPASIFPTSIGALAKEEIEFINSCSFSPSHVLSHWLNTSWFKSDPLFFA